MNIRLYRYPHEHKYELEKQVVELLQQRGNMSKLESICLSCLLVSKKDGSMRMCIDYKELNELTIKEKFPIPVIEDLLDELHGAAIFMKFDLKSGHHQIIMHPCDIQKAFFRTHHGQYKFLVMPFGLTNAPATFQSLMNELLAKFLRKFILVFFDDILVYS